MTSLGQRSTLPEPEVRREALAAPGHYWSSGKTYTYAHGLSCAFRQWRAQGHSHCSLLHGYSLQVELEWKTQMLDDKNWVQDFGGLKEVRSWLESMFDHKTLVAFDDPQISIFRELHTAKIIDLNVVSPGVGCEHFAQMIYDNVRVMSNMHRAEGHFILLDKVTVREHAGNHASYGRLPTDDRFVHSNR